MAKKKIRRKKSKKKAPAERRHRRNPGANKPSKATLLELIVLLKSADSIREIETYVKARRDEFLGWVSKDEVDKKRAAAEKRLEKLEKQFKLMQF